MIKKISYYIACISFIIVVLISAIDFWGFNDLFYAYEYKQNKTSEVTKIASDDLEDVTEHLLGYIKGDYDNLDIEVKVDGIEREVFNQREKDHMIDVYNLYQGVIFIRNGLLLVIVFCFIVAKFDFTVLFNVFRNVIWTTGGIVGALSMYAIMDFDSFWLNFHYLFFTNDLFLLNPSTDILIMLVPSRFFFDLIVCIVLTLILVIGLVHVWLKRGMKNA